MCNDPFPAPPYTELPFDQIVNFLKMAKINTLKMHKSLKELIKTSHPEWLSSSGSGDENKSHQFNKFIRTEPAEVGEATTGCWEGFDPKKVTLPAAQQ